MTTYPQAGIYSCPLGKGALRWRYYHKIDYFNPKTENCIKSTCLCCKPQQLGAVRNHLQIHKDCFNLHKAVYQYLYECEQKLKDHYQYYVDTDSLPTKIRSMAALDPRVRSEESLEEAYGGSYHCSDRSQETIRYSDATTEMETDDKTTFQADVVVTSPPVKIEIPKKSDKDNSVTTESNVNQTNLQNKTVNSNYYH